MGKGDKGKIDGVEHQFDRHEDRDQLRLIRKPTMPSENSTALNIRYQESEHPVEAFEQIRNSFA